MANDLVSCPSCGKPVVVPKMDKGELEQTISKVFSGSSFCQQFPALCAKVERIDQIVNSHPKPDKNIVQTWRSCPECSPELDRLIKSGVFDQGRHPVVNEVVLKHWRECPECAEQAKALGIELPKVEQEKEQESEFPWVQEEV